MTKEVRCPSCGHTESNENSELSGKLWRCPECGNLLLIPPEPEQEEIPPQWTPESTYTSPAAAPELVPEEEPHDPEKQVGVLCGKHLKLEAGIYAVFGTIIGLFLVGLSILLVSIIQCVRSVITSIEWFIRNVNWCVARSILRMVSILGEIIACGILVMNRNADFALGSGFFNADPQIQYLHTVLAFAVSNVVFYLMLLVFTRTDEMEVVCKYTSRYTVWTRILDEITKKL